MKPYDIRLGVCCSPDRLETVRALGYDYAEMGLAYIESLSEDEFLAVLGAVPSGFRVEAVNGLLPESIHLSDEQYSPEECRAYLNRAFARAVQLGVRTAVFGSGRSRNIPEGFSRERAEDQLADFGRILGDTAAEYGISAVIEPLNYAECNVLNTVREAAELAHRVGSPNLAVLADLYHVVRVDEPVSDLADAGPLLRHCHIANPDGRTAPSPDDSFDYRPFFDTLRAIGYHGGVSIEGGWKDFVPEAKTALGFLRELAE